jgi:uncharacterized protein YbjT (DUF2867 family)
MSSKIILVTTATGKIGKYLIPLLLQKNYTVHALVRSLDSLASRALGSIGAKLFKGDFDDIDSIKAAAKGAYGVLVNAVPTFGSTKEADHVENIVNASKEAGASAAVYISGFLLNRKEEFPNYGPSHPFYFINESKERAEKAVRQAGFEYWTILRPVAFMDNFFTDLAQFQWPHLYKEHILLTTVSPGVEWALVDPLSIAEYVESAFTNLEIFQQEEIELASDPSTTGSDSFGDDSWYRYRNQEPVCIKR